VLLVTLLLVGIGIVMVYSGTVYSRQKEDGLWFLPQSGYLLTHLKHVGWGLAGLMAAAVVPYRWYRKHGVLVLVGTLVLMFAVVAFGITLNAAKRWTAVGDQTVQLGELAKLGFVVWMAFSLARREEDLKTFQWGFMPYLVGGGLLLAAFYLQTDGGSTIIVGAMMLTMMWVAKVGWRNLALFGLIAVPLLSMLVVFSPVRRDRVVDWLHPDVMLTDSAVQPAEARIAVASGGLFGAGPGAGMQNISGALQHNDRDYIFALIAEELGFVGAVLVILCFMYLAYRGFRMAGEMRPKFERYLAFGVTLLLSVHALVHIAVSVGLFPTKGLNLPFISRGGTSMLACCAAVGVLLHLGMKVGIPASARRDEAVDASSDGIVVKEAK
jgi:cell division protein FtsW